MLTFHLWELEEFSLEARESPLLVGNQRDEHNVLGGQEGQVVRRSIVPTEPTKEGTESVRQLHSEPQVAQISSEQGQELHHQDFRAAQDQPVSSHKDSVPHTEPIQTPLPTLWRRNTKPWGHSPHQSMGLHRAQRVIHLDVVTAVCALLQVQCLEGQADDGVGICPQCPVAACIVGVRAVGEPWRGETGDLPFLGVEGEKATICPGEQQRVIRANEEEEKTFLVGAGYTEDSRCVGVLPSCRKALQRTDQVTHHSWITASLANPKLAPSSTWRSTSGKAPPLRPFLTPKGKLSPCRHLGMHRGYYTETEEELYLLS